MKLLAISDIHNNLVAVRRLRTLEKNSFDAIVVAGDIGSDSADDFFKIVSTFRCPVLYVYGNWDHELSYKKSFGHDCRLIHMNVVTIGKWHFTGFSGCPTNWGKNPIAEKLFNAVNRANKNVAQAYAKADAAFWSELEIIGLEQARKSFNDVTNTPACRRYLEQLEVARKEIANLNRERLGSVVRRAGINPNRTIVVTHERLYRSHQNIPGLALHLFGHIHRFSEHVFKGTRFLNVSALDGRTPSDSRKNNNAGNYTVIDINNFGQITAKCMNLRRNLKT